jgi:two-component system, OmpR family, alkaline phosphatase synthesis response regulator PhoP
MCSAPARYGVLSIDPDTDEVKRLTIHLSQHGYLVHHARLGEEGLRKAASLHPDVLLMDLLLPDLHGFDLLRMLQIDAATADIPIIVTSARGDEDEVVTCLNMGAANFMHKPLRLSVLAAYLRAILRSRQGAIRRRSPHVISVRDLTIDLMAHTVCCAGRLVSLSPSEFSVLVSLAEQPNTIFSKSQIAEVAGRRRPGLSERSIVGHIASVRRKLGRQRRLIETVGTRGYVLRSGAEAI